MIRVLIADDQPLVRTGLRMILDAESDIDVVGEVADGRSAVTAATELSPDVILMDVRMPGVDGIEATRIVAALDNPPGSSCSPPSTWTRWCTTHSARARAGSCSRTRPRSG